MEVLKSRQYKYSYICSTRLIEYKILAQYTYINEPFYNGQLSFQIDDVNYLLAFVCINFQLKESQRSSWMAYSTLCQG